MKGRGGALLMMLIGAGLAYLLFTGKLSTDSVQAPDSTDEAAGGVLAFFDWFGDFVSSLTSQAWTVIVLISLVGIGIWMFRQVPMRVWLIILLFGVVVAVMQ